MKFLSISIISLVLIGCSNKKEASTFICSPEKFAYLDTIYNKKGKPADRIEENLKEASLHLLQSYYFTQLEIEVQQQKFRRINDDSKHYVPASSTFGSAAVASATSSALAALGGNFSIIKPTSPFGNLLTGLSRISPVYASALAASSVSGYGSFQFWISKKQTSAVDSIACLQREMQFFRKKYFEQEAKKLADFFILQGDASVQLPLVMQTATSIALSGKDSVLMNSSNYFFLDLIVSEHFADKKEIDVFKKVRQDVTNMQAESKSMSNHQALKEALKAIELLNQYLISNQNNQKDKIMKDRISKLVIRNNRLILKMKDSI